MFRLAILVCTLGGAQSFTVPTHRPYVTATRLGLVPRSLDAINQDADRRENNDNDNVVGTQTIWTGSEPDEIEQQESFLKQGIEQFATEFQSLGTTSVDENQQQHEVDNNNNNHLVKDLETELEELEAQAKELRNELQRERFDRVAERQAASQQLAKLRDTASRDTSKAILAEQLKMDTVRVQLERRLEEQGSELVTARASLRTQAQEITKLRSQVMELEAERSNVWSLFRQSMRVIKKGFGNRLFGGRRRNSNELDSNDKNNNSNAPPTMTRSSTNNNNNNNNNNSFGFNKKRNTSNDPASVIDRVAEKDNDAVVSKDETA